MIVGIDDDLAGEATRIANRLNGLLTQIHPSSERVLGPRLQHPAVLTLLERFGSPAQIREAGRHRLVTLLRPKAPRMAERLVEDIFTTLDEQTVTVPGTGAATLIVPSLAASLSAVLDQRKLLAGRSRSPTCCGSTSWPGCCCTTQHGQRRRSSPRKRPRVRTRIHASARRCRVVSPYRGHGWLVGGGARMDRPQDIDLVRIGVHDVAVSPLADIRCVDHGLPFPDRSSASGEPHPRSSA